jgi:histidinol-phosphate phosphatase family protein
MNRAVFLDRDGTILKEKSYTLKPEQVELIEKVGEGIKLLNDHGFKVFVVTNQSVISRKYITPATLHQIHNQMLHLLSPFGGKIEKVYYCPHLASHNCTCRKPKPGMVEEAVREFGIDIEHSYIVGDRSEDIELGNKIGLKTVLVLTGYGKFTSTFLLPHYQGINFRYWEGGGEVLSYYGVLTLKPISKAPNFVAPNLFEACKWICREKG